MANINLLPWREKERERAKKRFFVYLGVGAAAAAVIVGIGHLFMTAQIANQTARNNYLTEQIAVLDGKIAEIRDIQEKKRELTERMTVIQDLQGRRPVIVRLFD